MVNSVRRSHFEDVSEKCKVCARAVLKINGALGSNSFSIAEGDDSIVATVVKTDERMKSVPEHAMMIKCLVLVKGRFKKYVQGDKGDPGANWSK